MSTATQKLSLSKIEGKCEEVAALLRALSHPQRLMVLGHLSRGPKTVSELQELCEISQSQLSQFLGRMKLEGLVKSERQGRFVYYSPANEKVTKLIVFLQKNFC